MIPDDVIEQVREASDLVAIIGEHVELKRTGSDYRGPCPFHGGTHRNFAVVPKKGMFYCFVCHEAGDVFSFFMKKLGMDYPTALREAARRAGITIPQRGPMGPDPREPLFSHEGQLLYNLHAAKLAMRKAERAILVEGQFDVLRVALAGVEEVVAPLGTGLTDDQAVLLQRHAPHVILLYDSDDAGLRATFRAGDVLLRHKLRVSVATMPEGEDPDTLVRRGGAATLEGILKQGIDVLERKIQILSRRGLFGSLEGRRRALDGLIPTIRAAADPVTRDFYITQVCKEASITPEALKRELQDTTRVQSSDDLSAEASLVVQL